MEYIEIVLKKNGWASIITSFIFVFIALILILNPEIAIKTVSYIIGIIFLGFGVFKVINYLKTKGKYDFYNYDIAYGIISIILGIIVMVYNSQIIALFRIMIGVWIIYSAILRINLSYKLKTMNADIWKYSLIISLVIFVCGIWVILTSNLFIRMIGICVLIYSILDIIEGIIFMKNVDKMV